MEKSWNFNHSFLEQKLLSCKNKQDRWKISRMAKNAPFSGKNHKKNFLGRGHSPLPRHTPTGREIPLTRPLTLDIYLCTYFLVFFGHCTYKSSHGKALIWSGKVMEIDFSKVVGTMDRASYDMTNQHRRWTGEARLSDQPVLMQLMQAHQIILATYHIVTILPNNNNND